MELREWQYMNKPANNSESYKKRFEKLIKYHIDHASSELESVTRKDISDRYFRLSEHYNDGSKEFDRGIIVYVDKGTEEFEIHIFIDHAEVESIQRKGYENFVAAIEPYMFLPDAGTQEYDDLLVEWVAMKNSNTSSQPAPSKTNKEKFTELVDYMQKHKDKFTTATYVNGLNDTGFEYEEHHESDSQLPYNLSIEVSLGKHDLFTIHVDKDGKRIYNIMAKGWEDLLRYLRIYFHAPNMGSPEYKSLTESFSIADDFKLYENLWN